MEDLEARLSAPEHKVAEVRQDAAAARVLAGAADRDVAEFRQALNAHTQVLNALRETQVEHHAETRKLQAETREGFAKTAAGMAQITSLLQALTDKD
jgi:predicted TIM-barrel fold metal-dependent hydrolase